METQCPLCGTRFIEEGNEGCKVCPRYMRCGMLLCPNCGYEFPKSWYRGSYLKNERQIVSYRVKRVNHGHIGKLWQKINSL